MELENNRLPYRAQFLANRRLALWLWFGLSFGAAIQAVWLEKFNNFLVYRSVFFHLIQQRNLYLFYPLEYGDVNLYGPVFGLVILPFALLPVKIAVICWIMSNALFLFWAISTLPISRIYQTALLILCSHELLNNMSWVQSNAMICGCIILGYTFTRKQKDHWALFFIMLATFVKLYGIIGLAFLPFSNNRLKFIAWAIIWSVVFFAAPVLLTSWHFLIQSYYDWYAGLNIKELKNIDLTSHYYFQDISFMGLIRRSFYPDLRDTWIIIPAILLYGSQFLYMKYFKDIRYQLLLLCSSLLFVVIFSTGSESPTYTIALPGICIWYFLQPVKQSTTWFFIVLFLFTTFSYSDLFTPWFRSHIVMPYSLKALPSCIIWCIIVFQIHRMKFLTARDISK